MSTAAPDTVSALLQALEEQLLQPEVRSSPEIVAALLADDFREHGSSGQVFTKHEIIAALAVEAPREIMMYDFHCQLLAPEVALVTYRSLNDGTSALRSSVWVCREGRWQMLFHQGTRVPA